MRVGTVTLRGYEGHAKDGDAVLSIWNDAMGDTFPLDRRLWRQNVDDDPHYDPRGIFLAFAGDRPVGLCAARVCRVPLGKDGKKPGQGWISALAVAPGHQRRGVGTHLLEAAEKWLAARKARHILVGGDPGHFFPGIPVEASGAQVFFEGRGYAARGDVCYDVRRDISDFTVPPLVHRVMARNVHFRISRCTNRQVPALIAFLEQTFPGRWLYETQLRLQGERAPGDIIVLGIGNRVVGFAHTFRPTSQRLGPSVYWRKLLGPQYGGLGPMGIATDVRGSGLGFALLCGAIEKLRDDGVVNMAIDWTVLLKFYGGAGFTPWKQYKSFERRSL